MIINSGNFLYSNFSQRINFSLREQILPLSTLQSPGPLSILGFLINKRQRKPSLTLPVMPRERQKRVLVYVCEEQWERAPFVMIFWAFYQIPGEELSPEWESLPKLRQEYSFNWISDKVMTVQVSGSAHPETKKIYFFVIEQLLWYQSFCDSIVTVYLAFTVWRRAWKCEPRAPKPLETWKTKYIKYIY